MTDTQTLLAALNAAKAAAFHEYEDNPDDDNHLRYQSLDELASAFEDMLEHEESARHLADLIPIPFALLEAWIHAIARNRLYPDDSAYIQVEDAIRTAATAVLTSEDIAAAKIARIRPSRQYGTELDPDDAVFPFLCEPTAENLGELNDWLKNVGKAAVRAVWQRDNKPAPDPRSLQLLT